MLTKYKYTRDPLYTSRKQIWDVNSTSKIPLFSMDDPHNVYVSKLVELLNEAYNKGYNKEI